MNKQRFTKVLREPGNLKDELEALQELQQEFPYAQALHVLVALAHKHRQTAEATNALNFAAIYVSDRLNLKQLIDKGVESNLTTYNQTKSQAINKERDENRRKADQGALPEEKVAPKVVEVSAPNPATTSGLKENPPIQKIEEDQIDEKINIVPKKGKSVFTHTQYDKNLEGEKMRSDLIMHLENLQAAKKEWGSGYKTDERQAEKLNSPEAPTAEETPSKSIPAKEKKVKASKKTIDKKGKKTTKEKSKTKKIQGEEAGKIKKQQELISKFIEKSPSLKSKANKPPIISAEQEDLSIPSTSFSDNLISENLAEILISQNKLDKAIDIYKKLIWKFPQKKAYFAAQIEELNKKKG